MVGGILQNLFRAGDETPSHLQWNGGMDPVLGMGPAPALAPPMASPQASYASMSAPRGVSPPVQGPETGVAPASGGFGSLFDVPSGSFLDKLHNTVRENSGMLLGMGAGAQSGGWAGMARGALQGSAYDDDRREKGEAKAEKERKRKGAYALALQMGYGEQQAAMLAERPEMLERVWVARQTKEPSEFERLTKGLDPDQIEQARLHRLGIAPEKPRFEKIGEDEETGKPTYGWIYPQSGKVVPYTEARSRGAADQVVTQGGGQPLPGAQGAGTPAQAEDGIRPRPAGADPKVWRQEETRRLAKQGQQEPLPGELAARFGLANQYFKRFDGIEKDLRSADPRSTGPIDSLGYGKSGAMQRDMKLGSEAMVRMLTGAGMSQNEAENEVKQYLPAPTDSAATVLDKQSRLRSALRDMQREALRGRMPQRQIDELYPEYPVVPYESNVTRDGNGPIGVNRATGGANRNRNSGRTRSGLSWSAE